MKKKHGSSFYKRVISDQIKKVLGEICHKNNFLYNIILSKVKCLREIK
jgi:hypothetical protein